MIDSVLGSLEGETIVERTCPGGWSSKYILLHGQYKPLDSVESLEIPDPRSNVPKLRSMEIFDDDIIIYAYPKCGM
jgi:hypothetical protein